MQRGMMQFARVAVGSAGGKGGGDTAAAWAEKLGVSAASLTPPVMVFLRGPGSTPEVVGVGRCGGRGRFGKAQEMWGCTVFMIRVWSGRKWVLSVCLFHAFRLLTTAASASAAVVATAAAAHGVAGDQCEGHPRH